MPSIHSYLATIYEATSAKFGHGQTSLQERQSHGAGIVFLLTIEKKDRKEHLYLTCIDLHVSAQRCAIPRRGKNWLLISSIHIRHSILELPWAKETVTKYICRFFLSVHFSEPKWNFARTRAGTKRNRLFMASLACVSPRSSQKWYSPSPPNSQTSSFIFVRIFRLFTTLTKYCPRIASLAVQETPS